MAQRTEDYEFMGRALELARTGLGRTWPNPSVGCVLVRDGVIVGEGVTAAGGRPHAETQALAMASSRARGATAYVTLEPCNHFGQTPPCSLALVEAEVERVVVALRDPDPRVDGAGTERLRAAGVTVTMGVREAEAREVVAGFLHRLRHARPLVEAVDGLGIPPGHDARVLTAQTDRTTPSPPKFPPPGAPFVHRVAPGTDPRTLVRDLGHHGLTRVAITPTDPLIEGLRTAGFLYEP